VERERLAPKACPRLSLERARIGSHLARPRPFHPTRSLPGGRWIRYLYYPERPRPWFDAPRAFWSRERRRARLRR
jgi:hypothetical protein